MSRKDFFRTGLGRLMGLVADQLDTFDGRIPVRPGGRGSGPARVPHIKAHVRPPGAREEPEFIDRCTRCDDCLKACAPMVIRKAGPEMGARLAGTPIIVPEDNPCVFCEELPCVTACSTGALVLPLGLPRIGTAVVDRVRCYQAQGQPCDYCEKYCPAPGPAILARERGKPAVVDPDTCTGCGSCAQLCPAKAIRIRETRGRSA